MLTKRRAVRFYAGWLLALLLILILLTGCASVSLVADGALWCDIYTPVYGVDHPVVHLNNAAYLTLCLEDGT